MPDATLVLTVEVPPNSGGFVEVVAGGSVGGANFKRSGFAVEFDETAGVVPATPMDGEGAAGAATGSVNCNLPELAAEFGEGEGDGTAWAAGGMENVGTWFGV